MQDCGLGKPALSGARSPQVLLALPSALGDEVHCSSVLDHQWLVLFLIVCSPLGLPRILLPVVPEGWIML